MLSTNCPTIRMSELNYMGILSPHCSYNQCTTHIGMCINSSLSHMTWNYFRSKCWWLINIAFICWKTFQNGKSTDMQIFLYRYNCIFPINGEYVPLFQLCLQSQTLISLFNNKCRYIDDILTVNIPNLLAFLLNLSWGTYAE